MSAPDPGALPWLNSFDDHGQSRAWKTSDLDAMDRLHERGLITDPKSKTPSPWCSPTKGNAAPETRFKNGSRPHRQDVPFALSGDPGPRIILHT
jgi:Domain of unknown function (DUF6429)